MNGMCTESAENLDPNATSATAAVGKKGKNTRSLKQTAAAGISLPPVLSALVAAANQLQVSASQGAQKCWGHRSMLHWLQVIEEPESACFNHNHI